MVQQFKSLLSGDRELRPLLDKAQALAALHRQFLSVAPPQLAQSSQVLGLQSGILSIAAGNAAVAAKLRQLAPELAVLLQNKGCEVNGIRVKVQVSFQRAPIPVTPRKLGKAAKDALHGLSQSLDDSPLRLALEKLSENKE